MEKEKDVTVKTVDLMGSADEVHVVIFLKGNQPHPTLRFIWTMNCHYCGKEFKAYRFPRTDRHHQCSKKCTDKMRYRQPRNRNLVTVVQEQA